MNLETKILHSIKVVGLVMIILLGHCQNGYTIDATKPNISGHFGTYVNSYTGNLFYQRNDLQIPGRGLLLDISFTYNSGRTQNNWGYGNGWSFSYGIRYSVVGNDIIIDRADGKRHAFSWNGSFYDPPVGVHDSIVEYQTGKYLLISKHGMRFFFDDSNHNCLTKIEDPNGNSTTLTYVNGVPTVITDPSGRMLNLTWSSGHLSQISDPNTTPNRTISYQYDMDGNLIQITNPAGNSMTYSYGNWNNMTVITDFRSKSISISYNSTKAVSSISCIAANTNLMLSYDMMNVITSATRYLSSGNQTTLYEFDSSKRISVIEYPDGNYVTYSWDNQNNISSFTDKNGNTSSYLYDSKGNIIKETDPLGNYNAYTFENTFNQVASYTDKNGNTTLYSYDTNGNLLGISDPLSNTESFTYSTNGLPLIYTNKRAYSTTFVYNNNGYKISETDALGNTKYFTYDAVGNKLSYTDQNSNTTLYQYDVLGNLINETNALGYSISYTYDENNNLLTVTNEKGNTTTYTYDDLNKLISTTDEMSNVNSKSYDEVGKIITETNAMGGITTYNYNCCNLISTIDPLNNIESYTYDANGNMLSKTNKNGFITSYTYNSLNRLLTETDPLNYTLAYTYDAVGNITITTDKNGNITTFAYDALYRLTGTSDPLNNSESYAYDAEGNLVTETDKNGHSSTRIYNEVNRLVSITSPLLSTTSFTYDPVGNRTSETNANNCVTSFGFDALNRLVSINDALQNSITYTYDPVGNQISKTDKNGNITTNLYDALDRLVSITNALSHPTHYSYDAYGNLISEIDALGNTTTFTYNWTRLVSKTDALGNSESFTYDGEGNQISYTDKNGEIHTSQFDGNNQTVSRINPLGITINSYSYDGNGNILTETDGNNLTTTYTYNQLNLMLTKTNAMGGVYSYAYDPVGNIVSTTDPIGNIISKTYNANDYLISESFPDNTARSYAYDAVGNLTQTINTGDPGEIITNTYDCENMLVSTETNFGSSNKAAVAKTITYGYDNEGNRTSITSPDGTINYSYNQINMVDSIVDQNGGLSIYEYDSVANVASLKLPNNTTTVYQYGPTKLLDHVEISNYPTNILTSIDFEYDPIGQKIREERDDTVNIFQYNNAGYMVAEIDSTNGDTIMYTYDNAGYRSSVSDNGFVLNYYRNPDNKLDSVICSSNPDKNTYYTLNSNGNRASRQEEGKVVTTLYNSRNEPVMVKQVIVPEDSVNYSVCLGDCNGGGWNYAFLSIVKNGAWIAEITKDSLNNPYYCYNIWVSHGDSLEFWYMPNFYSDACNFYELRDSNDAVVMESGQLFTAFTSIQFTVNLIQTDSFSNYFGPFGQLIAQDYNNNLINKIWTNNELLAEYDSLGNLIAQYNPVISRTDSAGSVKFSHSDLNRTILITEANGNPGSYITMDEFGNNVTGNDISLPARINTWSYNEIFDFYSQRTFMYDPETGSLMNTNEIISSEIEPFWKPINIHHNDDYFCCCPKRIGPVHNVRPENVAGRFGNTFNLDIDFDYVAWVGSENKPCILDYYYSINNVWQKNTQPRISNWACNPNREATNFRNRITVKQGITPGIRNTTEVRYEIVIRAVKNCPCQVPFVSKTFFQQITSDQNGRVALPLAGDGLNNGRPRVQVDTKQRRTW